ncbi:MAG: hypothetical protein ACQKBV_03185 [Puniceicoccales bacterium]
MITDFSSPAPATLNGFGLSTNHYVSGRVSVAVASHGGITNIRYYGEQPHPLSLFLEADPISGFSKLFRLQVIINDRVYFPEFERTLHFPFGYRSECTLAGVKIQHELILDQNAVHQAILVLDNPEQRAVRARVVLHGHMRKQAQGRENSAWEILENGGLRARTTDSTQAGAVETLMELGATQPLHSTAKKRTFKYYTETTESADSIVFTLAFNHNPDPLNARDVIDQKIANHHKTINEGLHFQTGNECLDSALNNTVPTALSLALADRPGAIRASQAYWVWGWDSMVHAEAWVWSGQTQLVRDMLEFYESTADPERGVSHAMLSDFTLEYSMAPSAQCLYVVLLYNYFAATGDQATLDKHLPFAKSILGKAGAARSKHNSLSTGMGFFPDHPEELEQQANDISLINNSLYFQALSAINELCGGYDEQISALRNDMESVLWDDQRGYWVDSVSETDLTQRRYYPIYGQLYVSPFGCTPHSEQCNRIGEFLREHFLFEQGIYMLPKELPGFMADGNQLGAYYPSVDRYYWNIMNRSRHADSANDFKRIVTRFWREHTYPEGLTHETENADPAIDNPGCKQNFAASSWCCDAIELNLGLQVRLHGFSLNPLPHSSPFSMSGLVLRGKRISIQRMPYSGGTKCIRLNGEETGCFINWEQLQAQNQIIISFE